ncbi:hypothetical protein TA3x_003465 [Tundrisphaera sp. TA3]|uniref:hypothetical protein n=1 Tax=Tundrisphaera sp. TA3 TaxID=3435775 RepID=UPI003EB914D3
MARGGYSGGYGGYRGGYSEAAGGFRAEGYRGSYSGGSAYAHGPYGGSAEAGRYRESGSGFGGAGMSAGRGGSVTGAGGTTASAGERGGVYTGPRGAVAIGGEVGRSVTGPGGNTIAGGRAGGVVVGPEGNVRAGSERGGFATGANGTVAAGRRDGIATGPGGTVAGMSRGIAAAGIGGAAYAGTRYVSRSSLNVQGTTIRNNFGYRNAFTPGWYGRYPGAWFAAGWGAGMAWNYLPWGGYTSYLGYPATVQPSYFDYGNTVTYQGNQVYYGDQPVATDAVYAQQAAQIATAGAQATPDPAADAAADAWQPLGVFAMVQGDETTSNDIFQLAINKAGAVRGNYYNAVSDSTTPLTGGLDKATQRIAWTIGDRKDPVYETGLYNLTQDQTTILAHQLDGKTAQYKLFRIPSQDGQQGSPAAPALAQ